MSSLNRKHGGKHGLTSSLGAPRQPARPSPPRQVRRRHATLERAQAALADPGLVSQRGDRHSNLRHDDEERLHKLVDELSEHEAKRALSLVEKEREDPMIAAFRDAPEDDEPLTAEEEAALEQSREEYLRVKGAARRDPPRVL